VSGYAWLITQDHIEGGADTGTRGPSGAPDDLLASLRAGAGYEFEIFDDDGELYYSGRYLGADREHGVDSEHAFGPLDDFGTPNAGATEIKYWDGRVWVTL
jgi:hypothetical protein